MPLQNSKQLVWPILFLAMSVAIPCLSRPQHNQAQVKLCLPAGRLANHISQPVKKSSNVNLASPTPNITSTPIESLGGYYSSSDQPQEHPIPIRLSTAPQTVSPSNSRLTSSMIVRSLSSAELQSMLSKLHPLPESIVVDPTPIDSVSKPPVGKISKLTFPSTALAMFKPPPPVKSPASTCPHYRRVSQSVERTPVTKTMFGRTKTGCGMLRLEQRLKYASPCPLQEIGTTSF